MLRRKCSKLFKDRKLLKTALISGLNISLVLLALNLLSVNFVIVEPSFMLISTVYLLLGLLLFNLPFKKLYSVIRRHIGQAVLYKTMIGVVLILFSFILLLATSVQMLWLISISILVSGLDLTLQGIQIRRRELYLLSVASFVYALFYILVQSIPILWYSIQRFSLMFSSGIGSLVGNPLLLGPSTSGLWIAVIFFIFFLVVFFLAGRRKKHFALSVLGLAICWLIYLIVLGFIEFESKSDVVNLHFILFLLCLIPTFVYLFKNRFVYEALDILGFEDIKIGRLIKNGAVWALVLLLLSGVILTVFPGADNTNINDTKENVLFYGRNQLGSWDVPEYGRYGKNAPGMFGVLPYYLNNSGYNARIVVEDGVEFLNYMFPVEENDTRYVNLTDYTTVVETENISRYINFADYITVVESNIITGDLLEDIDIFVVINLNESFSSSEHQAIWSFVEKGGSLLVLGDHTDIGGIQDPLNDLLEPVGISYRFDSALPIDPDFNWIPCYHLLHHPFTYKINSLDAIDISVGASLDISVGSFPMLIGRYGLSDVGDRLNAEGAYLGDYEYNRGEQIGDIILAAGAYYGNGRVLVFGDTSPFQNTAIIYSLPLVHSAFNWLSSNRTAAIEYSQIAISLTLLIVAAMLYLIISKHKIHFVFFPIILCIALVLSTALNPVLLGETEIKGNIAYIDASHRERFNLEPYEDDSLSGLMLNLMRNNYLPIVLRDFSEDKIKNCEMLIFNAPTKSFTEGEVDFIKQYIHDRGLVILSTGYLDKEASMPLLREFELDIYDLPLGPVPYVEEGPEEYQEQPRFVDSWLIIGEIGEDENDTTYPFYSIEIEGYEYILMTYTQNYTLYGDGAFLLISDSEFLTDKNIESLYDYWPGNIHFLKNIIDELTEKGVLS